MVKVLSIGTIGDKSGYLTCSMSVAHKAFPYAIIVPFSSFENAIMALKANRVLRVIVPAAYPLINSFIMDSTLTISDYFIMPIPPLVFALKGNTCEEKDIKRVYTHKATACLLDEVNLSPKPSIVYVNSNIEACKRLKGSKTANSGAITNRLCADYYKLKAIHQLRDSVDMPWVVFKLVSGQKE